MLAARPDEARQIYKAHAGMTVPDRNGLKLDELVSRDFVELRRAGMTHPLMDEILRR